MSDQDLEPTGDENPDEATVDPDEQDAGLEGGELDGDGDGQGEHEEAQRDAEAHAAVHLTPEALEKRAKSADKRFNTYAAGIKGLYEQEAQFLTPCPLCPDNHKGLVDLRAAGFVPEEVQDACRLYFGIAREIEYPLDPDYSECPKCHGEGFVSRPTKVAAKRKHSCSQCGGNGYLGPPDAAQPERGGVTGPTVYAEEGVATQAYEDRDEWDEPRLLPDGRENPNFGKMPNRKVLVEPWGQTAGLNALDRV